MFLLRRPADRDLDRFVTRAKRLPLTYWPVGLARQSAPAPVGYRVGEAAGVLGHGEAVFTRASRLLDQWRQFDLGWAGVYPTDAPPEMGTTIAIYAQHLGFWSVHACRVVYTLEPDAGFAYGTLADHAETGEEIFRVSMDSTTGAVTYFIRAVSHERALLARLGTPIAQRFQDRFRRDSAAAMRRHISTVR